MRMSLFLMAAAIVTAVPSAAAPPSQKTLASELSGLVPGEPQSCISLRSVRGSEVIRGEAIIYRTSGSLVYVQRPDAGAEQLSDRHILVSRTPGHRLCSMDTIDLVDRASRTFDGFVALGDFIPYTRPEHAAK